MALTDILFPDGDSQNFIISFNRGNGGIVSDIVTEEGSNPGMLVNEIPGADSASNAAYTWVS